MRTALILGLGTILSFLPGQSKQNNPSEKTSGLVTPPRFLLEAKITKARLDSDGTFAGNINITNKGNQVLFLDQKSLQRNLWFASHFWSVGSGHVYRIFPVGCGDGKYEPMLCLEPGHS